MPFLNLPQEMDPPEFFEYRRLLNPTFSPESSRRHEPFIRQVTIACLDKVSASGRADLVMDVTNPVPAIMILKILGLPLDDWKLFALPIHEVSYSPPGSDDGANGGIGE
jgi:cytochrome P450